MKKRTYSFLFLIMILIVGFNSCTIEKRSYQPGYFVDWHNVNRKSEAKTENLSEQKQETIFQEKIVTENKVEEIEDFNQLEVIQDFEPAFSSNDESINNIEIIKISNQEKSFNYEIKEEIIEVNTPVRKENISISPKNKNNSLPVYDGAIVGLVLSILAILFFIGAFYSESVIIGLFLLLIPSFIFALLGVIISIISIIIIQKNQDKYSGLWLAISGIGISLVFLFVILLF